MARRRLISGIACVTVLIAGAWWWTRHYSEPPDGVAKSRSAAPAESTDPKSAAPAAATPSPIPARPADGSAAEATRSQETGESDASAPSRTIPGTIIVTDEAGVQHSGTSGWLGSAYAIGESDEARSRRVEVKAGAFTLRGIKTQRVHAAIAELDGRFAWLEDEMITIPETGPVVVKARWVMPITLQVVDAESGTDLNDVTVLRATDDRFLDDPNPGDRVATEELAKSARSPFEVNFRPSPEALHWSESVWVRARDRAWKVVDLDYRSGASVKVELSPGADLEVFATGAAPIAVRACVRVRQWRDPPSEKESIDAFVADAMKHTEKMRDDQFPGHHRWTEAEFRVLAKQYFDSRKDAMSLGKVIAEASLVASTPTTFLALPTGTCLVSVEERRTKDHPLILGSAKVELTPGERKSVTIALSAPPVPKADVPLSGRIIQSTSWGSSIPHVSFEPCDIAEPSSRSQDTILLTRSDLHPDSSRPGVFGFDLGLVKPGRYVVRDYKRGFEQVVDTGSAGRNDVEVVMGDPAEITLRPVDATTREELRLDETKVPRLSWHALEQTMRPNGEHQEASWDQSIHAWRFHASTGEIQVFVSSVRFEGRSFLQIVPGENHLDIPVESRCGIVIFFELDGVRIDPPKDTWRSMHVERPDGTPVEHDPWVWDGHGHALVLSEPGTFRVVVERVADYQIPDPFDATVDKGQFVEHVIALTRAQ